VAAAQRWRGTAVSEQSREHTHVGRSGVHGRGEVVFTSAPPAALGLLPSKSRTINMLMPCHMVAAPQLAAARLQGGPSKNNTRTPTHPHPHPHPHPHQANTHLDGRGDIFSGQVRRLEHHRHRHRHEPERPDVDVRASVAKHRGSCSGSTECSSTSSKADEDGANGGGGGDIYSNKHSRRGKAGQGAGRSAESRQDRPARRGKKKSFPCADNHSIEAEGRVDTLTRAT